MSSLEGLVARGLVEAGVEILEIDAAGATVRLPDGPEQDLRFGNLRRSLAVCSPEAADAVVARFVRLWGESMRAPPAPVSEVPALRLFPHLLAPGSADGGLGAPWVEKLAGGHLLMALCSDDGETLRMVKLLDFPRLGLSVAAAKAGSLERLAASSAPLAAELAARPDPLAPAELSLGDGHDAARLLVVERWFPGASGVLALAPCRDLLLVAPVGEGGAAARALGAALAWRRWAFDAVHTLPYPVSPQLFWRAPGELEVVVVQRGADGRATVLPPAGLARLLGSAGR